MKKIISRASFLLVVLTTIVRLILVSFDTLSFKYILSSLEISSTILTVIILIYNLITVYGTALFSNILISLICNFYEVYPNKAKLNEIKKYVYQIYALGYSIYNVILIILDFLNNSLVNKLSLNIFQLILNILISILIYFVCRKYAPKISKKRIIIATFFILTVNNLVILFELIKYFRR